MHNTPQPVSKETVDRAVHGWHVFTRFTFWSVIIAAIVTALVVALIAY